MPTSPSVSIASPRPDLAAGVIDFDERANQDGLVGLQIAPVMQVGAQFGRYRRIKAESMLKPLIDTRRGSDGSYKKTEGNFTYESFQTEDHGIEERLDDREVAIYQDWVEQDTIAARRLNNILIQDHDRRVMDAALTAAAANDTTALTTRWTDSAADPIADIRARRIAFRNRTGHTPNAMVIEWEIFEHLRDNAKIVDRINAAGTYKDMSREQITVEMVAKAFDMELIVAGAMKNTANKAKAAVFEAMWDKTKCLIFRKDDSKDMTRPRFMNTLHWGGDGSIAPFGVFEEYRAEDRRSGILRNRFEVEEKVVYSNLAEELTNLAA